ncbi:hypothetical protein J3459_009754 [Metarhizium acridum]|nr:hypothetical protein J3459_009754 [Metarhizium acridum]
MSVKGHLHLYPFDRSRASNRGVQGSFLFLSRTTTRRGRSCLPFLIELSQPNLDHWQTRECCKLRRPGVPIRPRHLAFPPGPPNYTLSNIIDIITLITSKSHFDFSRFCSRAWTNSPRPCSAPLE